LVVLPPEDALRRARPLPSVEELTIAGLTLDEWNAEHRPRWTVNHWVIHPRCSSRSAC